MEKREELKAFLERAVANDEIREDLTKHSSPDAFYKGVVDHGKNLGYDFSEEDVRHHLPLQGDRELSDSELNVSGGENLTDFISQHEKGELTIDPVCLCF